MDVSTTSVWVCVYWVLVSAVGWFSPKLILGELVLMNLFAKHVYYLPANHTAI